MNTNKGTAGGVGVLAAIDNATLALMQSGRLKEADHLNIQRPKLYDLFEAIAALPAKWRAEVTDHTTSTSLWDQGYAHGRQESADELDAAFHGSGPATS